MRAELQHPANGLGHNFKTVTVTFAAGSTDPSQYFVCYEQSTPWTDINGATVAGGTLGNQCGANPVDTDGSQTRGPDGDMDNDDVIAGAPCVQSIGFDATGTKIVETLQVAGDDPTCHLT